ncbi:hypothetical protein RHGRI_004955 [Rhododendron griersonianum]|uniref:Uncharacterized protein n=1 Tax=Rhododendron griersonianum TaxID=479676 RepID=A0AAV6KLY3_9ERIC|nr:hypothetical protein RHGRI_011447 [Rhododendron griersonianum]KAG5562081.1 hypothetical protein RHGRI_004955 [Rhododendron griersonianum]
MAAFIDLQPSVHCYCSGYRILQAQPAAGGAVIIPKSELQRVSHGRSFEFGTSWVRALWVRFCSTGPRRRWQGIIELPAMVVALFFELAQPTPVTIQGQLFPSSTG